MAFTYPPSGVAGTLDGLTDVTATGVSVGQSLIWNGSAWVPSGPFGSLLSPQIVQPGGPNTWIPRVTVLPRGNNASDIREGRALPLSFSSAVRLTSIKIPFFNNLARTGTQPWGDLFANPGWQVKAYIYAANSSSGMPSTLLRATNLSTISNTTDGGPSQGTTILTFSSPNYLDLAANSTIWVAIVSQPLFVAEFPTGWNPNNKYVYSSGTWSVNNSTGAYLESPLTFSTTNQLAPLSSLPEVPWFHEEFGFPWGSNSLHYPAPLFDYDNGGPGTAVNLNTWSGFSSWPSEGREWPTGSGNQMTFPYATTGDSTFFYAAGQDPAWNA